MHNPEINTYLSVMKQKIVLSYLIICVLLLCSFSVETTCNDFRTGQFTSNYLKHLGVSCVYIRTDDSSQTEVATFPNDVTVTLQYKVVWRTDCKYILYFQSSTLREDSPRMTVGDSIEVVIQKVIAGNKIQIQSNFKGWLLTDTLTKID